jgi:hypothetical protein
VWRGEGLPREPGGKATIVTAAGLETTGTSAASLARRLDAFEARTAITELKHRYWRACDAKDPVSMRACFVDEGADIDVGPLGRFGDADALVAIFERIALRRLDDGSYRILDMHHGMHEELELTSPTTASGRWTLRFRQVDRVARTQRVAAVEYDDDYRLGRDGWRIARSHARELWSVVTPLADTATIEEHIDG